MPSGRLTTLFLFIVLIPEVVSAQAQQSPNQIMKKLLGNYDKSLPANYPRPTNVTISIYIMSVTLDEERMEMKVDMYFRLGWADVRLRLPRDHGYSIHVPHQFYKRLWLPDLMFANAKINVHNEPVQQAMIRLTTDGKLLYSRRLTGVFNCEFDHRHYPNDEQTCDMNIESFGNTVADLHMSFQKDVPVSASASALRSTDRTMLDGLKTRNVIEFMATGSYQRLAVSLTFSSRASHVIRHTIAPCLVLVIITYVSFLLGRKHPTIRFGYLALVGVLMAMSALNANMVVNHPKISYMTYVDIYYTFSSLMYMAAILHFVLALRLNSRRKEASSDTDIVRLCDIAGMIWYPLAFVVFNIIFFVKCFS